MVVVASLANIEKKGIVFAQTICLPGNGLFYHEMSFSGPASEIFKLEIPDNVATMHAHAYTLSQL